MSSAKMPTEQPICPCSSCFTNSQGTDRAFQVSAAMFKMPSSISGLLLATKAGLGLRKRRRSLDSMALEVLRPADGGLGDRDTTVAQFEQKTFLELKA